LLEALQKCSVTRLSHRIVRRKRIEHANAPHAVGLLRARRERPRHGCAAQTAEEISTSEWTEQDVFSTLPVGVITTVSPKWVRVLG